MAEIKNCPFCFGTASLSIGKRADGEDWHYIECDTLGCGAIADPDAWDSRSPDPIREEMARALEACRSALDGLMGDTDLDGDDSPEMKAMQMASAALSKHRDGNDG